MSWFKTDDKLPNNRKARAVRKSHPKKSRDVAPFGLWVLAGAWSDDGWVPLEWLEDWDDDAEELAERLVAAGLWHHAVRDGEQGYIYHDWHDQNPVRDDNDPSKTGTFGNHIRWHVQRQVVAPDCDHCPKEPDSESADHRGDIGAMVAPDIGSVGGESLPSRPDPTDTRPEPDPEPLADKSAEPDRFDEFWDAYAYKIKRVDAERAWAKATKKADPDRIIAAATAYVAYIRADKEARGDRAPDQAHASSWLNGERWLDERKALPQQMTRVQQGLALVQQLALEEEAGPRQIGSGR